MKVKVKFDVASVKKWLLEHGEKVAFGVTALVFLLFVYSAATREVLGESQQPEKLTQIATDVNNHVRNSQFVPERENLRVIEYDKRATRELISAAAFPLPTVFDPPLADQKTKRGVPELYAMEELHVAAGFGPFALREPGAEGKGGGSGATAASGAGIRPSSSAKLQPQAWAVITGLIPIDKQTKEYARVFERAMNGSATRDVPHYAGVVVERAEVKDSEPNKLEWQKLPGKSIEAFEKQWEVIAPEVISGEYIDPALTGHLGPLVGADWDASVSHPKIPLAQAGTNKAQAVVDNVPKAAEPAAAAPKDEDNGMVRARAPASAAPAPPPVAEAAKNAAVAPVSIGYRLLRVFDYSVEPKKKYRYRLTVGVDNANFQCAPQFLQDPQAAKADTEVLMLAPTEPTDVVVIPDGYRVLAGRTRAARGIEPSASLMATAVDKGNGVEAAVELNQVMRGAVANTRQTVIARDPRSDKPIELESVDFASGAVVLDIRGGRAMDKKKEVTIPGEILLLEAGGNLVVREELADHVMYEHFTPPEKPESSSDKSDIPGSGNDSKPKRTPARAATSTSKSGR